MVYGQADALKVIDNNLLCRLSKSGVRLILFSFPSFGLLRPNAFLRDGSIWASPCGSILEIPSLIEWDVPRREPCPSVSTGRDECHGWRRDGVNAEEVAAMPAVWRWN